MGKRPYAPRKAPATRRKPRSASYTQNNLFELMDRQRMTARAMAAAIERHQVSLSYWRTGKNDMRLLDAEMVAKELGYELVLMKSGVRDATIVTPAEHVEAIAKLLGVILSTEKPDVPA